MSEFREITRCRICDSDRLARVLDLGSTPLANAFRRPDDTSIEPRYPLIVLRCQECGLVQLGICVDPSLMFRNYLYASSASAPSVDHFNSYAAELMGQLPRDSLIVEIGSNDGILLRPLIARGARAIGVEPATNLAVLANAEGIETWAEFFGEATSRRIRERHGPAKAVVANNVLAHIDDLNEVLRGLDVLLDTDGIFVAEVPYLGDLLEHTEYDTIYHEHLSYFHLAPLAALFRRADLELFDVRHLPIHGGSVRLYVSRARQREPSARLLESRAREAARGIGSEEVFRQFRESVEASREALLTLLGALRGAGRRIAGLGATAKGNTLLNYCSIGRSTLEYIADSTELKHGYLTPGTHIPVVPERVLLEDRPDYVLLLAWNYADSIVQRYAPFIREGGQFIHPIPRARVLST